MNFLDLQQVWVMPPTAHAAPYPARVRRPILITDWDSDGTALISPDNDRGMEGEMYEVPIRDLRPA